MQYMLSLSHSLSMIRVYNLVHTQTNQLTQTTPYHIWTLSSENVPSRLLGQLHGTVFLQNCAPYQTVLFLRTSSKPIFLIWLLTFS